MGTNPETSASSRPALLFRVRTSGAHERSTAYLDLALFHFDNARFERSRAWLGRAMRSLATAHAQYAAACLNGLLAYAQQHGAMGVCILRSELNAGLDKTGWTDSMRLAPPSSDWPPAERAWTMRYFARLVRYRCQDTQFGLKILAAQALMDMASVDGCCRQRPGQGGYCACPLGRRTVSRYRGARPRPGHRPRATSRRSL